MSWDPGGSICFGIGNTKLALWTRMFCMTCLLCSVRQCDTEHTHIYRYRECIYLYIWFIMSFIFSALCSAYSGANAINAPHKWRAYVISTMVEWLTVWLIDWMKQTLRCRTNGDAVFVYTQTHKNKNRFIQLIYEHITNAALLNHGHIDAQTLRWIMQTCIYQTLGE